MIEGLFKKFMRATDENRAYVEGKTTQELADMMVSHLESVLTDLKDKSKGKIRLAFNVISSYRSNRQYQVVLLLEQRAGYQRIEGACPIDKNAPFRAILELLEKENDPSAPRLQAYIQESDLIESKAKELAAAQEGKSDIVALRMQAARTL